MAIALPQAPPAWNHTPEDLTRLTKDAIGVYKEQLDKVGGLKPEASNFSSVRWPMCCSSIQLTEMTSGFRMFILERPD